MFITEYNQERAYAEQRADGEAIGMAKGGLLMLFGLVKKGVLTLAQAAEEANMPVSEFKLQMEHLG